MRRDGARVDGHDRQATRVEAEQASEPHSRKVEEEKRRGMDGS
jgi:hypothetical protein